MKKQTAEKICQFIDSLDINEYYNAILFINRLFGECDTHLHDKRTKLLRAYADGKKILYNGVSISDEASLVYDIDDYEIIDEESVEQLNNKLDALQNEINSIRNKLGEIT